MFVGVDLGFIGFRAYAYWCLGCGFQDLDLGV